MAMNVAGVVVMVVFYLLVLGTGVWASFKSRREAKKTRGDMTEMALLGNRGISLVVGIFTMTGKCVCTRACACVSVSLSACVCARARTCRRVSARPPACVCVRARACV